jgi:hypothetical protein
MAQPIPQEPAFNAGLLLKFTAVVCGTVYVVSLVAAAVGRDWPELLIDAARAGFITLAVVSVIRTGFRRIAATVEQRADRFAEG